MRYARSILLSAALTLVLGVAAPARGQTCDTTFGGPGTDWNTGANWDPGTPGSGDVACIPAGKTALLDSGADGECKAIKISRLGASVGKVYVVSGKKLTIHSAATAVDSTIDGELLIGSTSKLRIARDLKIKGNGGAIKDFYGPGTIESADAPTTIYELTLEGYDNDDRSTSLVLHQKWDINVKLKNDAYVVADWDNLKINEGGSGGGYWIAEEGQGTGKLWIGKEVTGGATWIVQGDRNAEIEINADCTSLTGDVQLKNGGFDVNADFTTAGHLDGTPEATGDQVSILVAADVTAQFNAP